jgi:hypothetical protein
MINYDVGSKFEIGKSNCNDRKFYNGAYFVSKSSMDVEIVEDDVFDLFDEGFDVESESDLNMIELGNDSIDMVEYEGNLYDDSGLYSEVGWIEFGELNRFTKVWNEWNKENYIPTEYELFLISG